MRPSQIAFAATIIALGLVSLYAADTPPWDGIPKALPGRAAIIDLCAAIEIAAAALLFRPTTTLGSRVLFPLMLLALVLLRLPALLRAPLTMVRWESFGEIAVLCAGAWSLRKRGVTGARWLVIVSLPMFGLSHFAYSDFTAALVPKWMHFGLGWTYLTGAADIAAAMAMLLRLRPRLAASLEAAMLGIITLLVWVPRVATTPGDPANWSELAISAAIAAGVWCVADTYRER